jgi:hypothetical protein
MNSTVNANIAECLKTATHLGFNRVHNVCTGAQTDVPWGGIDWLLFLGVSGIVAAIILMVTAFAITILRDTW